MKALKIIASLGFGLVILLGLIFTWLYLFRTEFMPYHATAVSRSWDEVDAGMQILILALMRVSGGGWLATSLGMGLLMIRYFKDDKPWIPLYTGLIGLSTTIPTLLATLLVRNNSPANPPWIAAAGAIAIIIISMIAGMIRAARLKKITD